MTPLIFLDTETTGLQPDRHTPWEVAWQTAIHDDGTLRLIDAADYRVDLSETEMRNADPIALKIGRFDERCVDPWPPAMIAGKLREACRSVSAAAGTPKVPHLVGAVPSFDHAMLTRWFGWPGFGEGLWHYHLIDVENLIAGNLEHRPPWDSDVLTAAIGVESIDEEFRHTAAGDVQWAVLLYAAVFDLTMIVDGSE